VYGRFVAKHASKLRHVEHDLQAVPGLLYSFGFSKSVRMSCTWITPELWLILGDGHDQAAAVVSFSGT
jgi:hypothetical protein